VFSFRLFGEKITLQLQKKIDVGLLEMMQKHRLRRFLLGSIMMILTALFLLQSCYKERFITDSDAKLAFSLDTLRFDTVFTELGSATRSFKVYNRNDLPIKVSKAYFESGSESIFRMNVDGLTGTEIGAFEIGANDSVYVFAEVTIDPNEPLSISPFILEELIVFETNGNTQQVRLEAWGQNANYVPNRFFQNGIGILSCDLEQIVWDDPKPYVIYGTLLIDSCELVLPPGTRVYVHGGVANNAFGIYNDGIIFTLQRGIITANGTPDQPVIIQDDRLEEDYTDVWGGIRLGPDSRGHSFKNTIIRHGIVGISVDSAASLTLENTIIEECSGFGIFGRHATISAKNCLLADHGGDALALTYGGSYTFDYCTVASYGNDSEALTLNNFYCTDPLCLEEVFFNPLTARFRNSILVGSSQDEIALIDGSGEEGFFSYTLENCIVKIDELDDADGHPDFFQFCDPCENVSFRDTLFVDIDANDYHLDTLSVAEELGMPIPGISTDLEGNQRDPVRPDVGCYEYIK
jgi:hypothetical protein